MLMRHKKNAIVLLGGGGHCKSVLDTIWRLNEYSDVVIVDPVLPIGTVLYGAKVVGSDEVLPKLYEHGISQAFITIGSIGKKENIELRSRLYETAKGIGYDIPAIIDGSALISGSAIIGEGTFIGKNAVVNAETIIGKMAIINTGAIIEHDCYIGDYSHVSVGTVVAGGVKVGNSAFIGANATIIQCRTIGSNSIVGAGSVILSDVPDDSVSVGVYKSHNS